MRILNLYAGLGGNRKLWTDVDVTAVEIDEDIAASYSDSYPSDKVVIGDAHEYLVCNYQEFDFIWSSPPCQSHSSFRQNICVRFRGTEPVYPDMKLYQEILFLQSNAKCKWVIENVNPYYEPLIRPSIMLQRHLFWSNFLISNEEFDSDLIRTAQIPDLQKLHGFNLDKSNIKNKRQALRNCVTSELGLHVFNDAFNIETPVDGCKFKQESLL